MPRRQSLSNATDADAALRTQRIIAASPREVFAAFEDPDSLARWRGPAGFTNTFERFELAPGAHWVFTMHGPNGAHYANESVFREMEPVARIVVGHVVKPWYRLTVTLAAEGEGDAPLVGAGVREPGLRRVDAPPQRDRQRAEPRPPAVPPRDGRRPIAVSGREEPSHTEERRHGEEPSSSLCLRSSV